MSYTDASIAAALQSALVDGGATVLSYIPNNTLMVASTPALASRVSSQLGAAAAALGPEHKISPDWEPLMTAATAGSETGPGSTATATSPSPPSKSDSTAQSPQAWLRAAQARARAVELLSQMRTLGGGGGGDSGVATAAAAAATSAVRYGVAVELLPGLSADELAAVGADWPTTLAAALPRSGGGGGGGTSDSASAPCGPPVVELAPAAAAAPAAQQTPAAAAVGQLLSVYLCEQDLAPGVSWLAGRDEAKWVAPLRAAVAANARSSILLQSGQISIPQYQDIYDTPAATNWPYWAAGLEGQGEVVGVGDTGLDVEGCAFSDPRFNGSYVAALANPTAAVLGVASYAQIPEHRKVVQYARMGIPGDYGDASGHGTLVCGSVAGAVLSRPDDPYSDVQLDDATGAAPKAKLSVVDAQGGDGGGGSLLWVPYDAYRLYLPIHRLAGAFITSDSWGIGSTGYESQSQSFDRFLWENPDHIALLSAGNDGSLSLSRFTLSAPAIAKNVVAVGAGSKLPFSYGARSLLTVQGVRLDGTTFSKPIFPVENYRLPTLASLVANRAQRPIPIAVALPLDACSTLRNPASAVRGAIVLATRSGGGGGGCDDARQARNVAAAGAAALVLVQMPPLDLELPNPTDADGNLVVQSLAVSMLDWDMGAALIGFIYEGGKLNLTRSSAPVDPTYVASYSSWGPTPDGRIKPDIIAPGELITSVRSSASAAGVDYCSTRDYSGTSASAPLAAGHVAIMRQYLRSGFYPTGCPTDPQSTPFTPSGMLLKALLIAGAASMEGGWALAAGRRLGPAPDGFQGWGRLSLPGALPLRNFTDPRVRLQLVDRGEFWAAQQSVMLTGLTATGTGPITAVLVYYDYPADPNALTALVNDLDLQLWVEGEGEEAAVHQGNNPEGAANPAPDGANTVERVRLRAPPAGASLRLFVSAASLPSLALDPTTPQRWAVAVVGHFEGSLQSELNPAWSEPAPKAPPPPSPAPPPQPPPPEVRKKRPSPPSKAPKSPPPPKKPLNPSPPPKRFRKPPNAASHRR